MSVRWKLKEKDEKEILLHNQDTITIYDKTENQQKIYILYVNNTN